MRLKHNSNITQESIKIGDFDKKLQFHFITIYFKNIKEVSNQGKILEYYFNDKNFLLLPRNEIYDIQENNSDEASKDIFYTSLMLFWTYDKINVSEIEEKFRNMFLKESNMYTNSDLFLNNGVTTRNLSSGGYNDKDGYYSYLITHQYIDNKYTYRITSTCAFFEHFKLLKNHNLDSNTVLDLVFTGKNTNQRHNTYDFSNYRVKDFLIKDGYAILSNTKGVIDLNDIQLNTNNNYVYIMNFLLDWKNPLSDGFGGMSVKGFSFVPEKFVRVKDGKIVSDLMIDLNQSIIIPKDHELRKEMTKRIMTLAPNKVNEIFVASKVTTEYVLANFDKQRMERKKQELINNRRELINMITMNKRSIRESEENILVLENRLRNFVPFPKIILPKTEKLRNEIDMPIDAFSMIKMKDDKYIIDGGDYSEI